MTTMTPAVAARLAAQPPKASGRPLTRRQLEVVRLVAAGLTTEQIGVRMHATPSSVRVLLRRAMAKLDAPTRAAAVDRAWRRGLLGPALVSDVRDSVR